MTTTYSVNQKAKAQYIVVKNSLAAFSDRLLVLTENPRGLQLLEMFRSNRVMRSSPDDLQPVKQLLKARQEMLDKQ